MCRKLSFTLYLCLFWLIFQSNAGATLNAYDKSVLHPAIPMLDEAGEHVLKSNKPYSPKKTCEGSGCHDYEKISHAYHFEMGRDESHDNYGEQRGVKPLVSPGFFGGINCMGDGFLAKKNNNPADPDYFAADYGAAGQSVKYCAMCHAGGGWGEKDRNNVRYDQKLDSDILPGDGDYYTRGYDENNQPTDDLKVVSRWNWKKSGVRENDCLMCHVDYTKLKKFSPYSGTEPAKNGVLNNYWDFDSSYRLWRNLRDTNLIEKGHFREAATALLQFYNAKPNSGIGESLVSFGVDVKQLDDGTTDYDNIKLKLDGQGKPTLKWNPSAFDKDGKIQLSMLRFPANENCWQCHYVDARRGMSHYGDDALPEKEANGTLKMDYKDDVHKGKEFTDDNGEKRSIENCSACHSKQYFKPLAKNVDLDADHNFPKGNSDADVRNDLDHDGSIKNCEYCHDKAVHKAIPSGQKSMLDAHLELWKASNNLNGYSADSLVKVTKTHLDVVACQTCHISDLRTDYDGKTVWQPFYRYRQAEDGAYKITPYVPYTQWYWQDKTSGRWLTNSEEQAITTHDQDHNMSVVDPVTGVAYKSIAEYGLGFEPKDNYGANWAIKRLYEALLKTKGYTNPNVQAVMVEKNNYLISHNVRESSRAQPCEACHTRKQNGAFSSLLSAKGLLGNDTVRDITEYWSTVKFMADPRLVQEGVVRMGEPYYKVANDGRVVASIGEILSATKENPFMSLLKNSKSKVAMGDFKTAKMKEVMAKIALNKDAVRQSLEASMGEKDVFYFKANQGHDDLKQLAAISYGEGAIAKLLLSKLRLDTQVFDNLPTNLVNTLQGFAGGKLISNVFWLGAVDADNKPSKGFPDKVYVKVPYKGKATNPSQVKVVSSVDGQKLELIDPANVLIVNPNTDAGDGYVIFSTERSQFFVLIER